MIDNLGIWGIGLGMLIESACIPLPSEVIMLVGGFHVVTGNFTFTEVVIAGVVGNLLGSILAYWIGIVGGRAFILKYGKYVLLNEHHLDKAESWFHKYGEWTVFATRNLPFIRTFISLPAGVARMNFAKFVVFTTLGCIPWNIALTYVGYRLGQNWDEAEPYIKPFSYIIAVVVVILVLRWVWKSRKTTGK
ncbi:DedA family protein [Paenibacillus sp. HB172176]|uniref:DedA family protein n=1 Tax=Paenibacillus sp. HB172176 TaxID=2493690 RepID=UPI001438B29A|nr:DedA family protein [Paenibacillus sp. HB172176]